MTTPVRLPKRIEVGPYVYSVSDSPKDHSQSETQIGKCTGFSDHGSGVITIDPSLALPQKRSTLLHEVLHCVWCTQGWGDPNRTLTQEEIVQRLEAPLLDVLRRNPQLTSYLIAKD